MGSPIESREACSQKLRDCSSVGGRSVDRISNLPESIVLHILSFLPARSVVATGVLSKRWKLVWTQVSTLDFEHSVEAQWRGGRGRANFVQFVNKVLGLHNAETIDKFRLRWWDWQDLAAECVDTWVSRVLARNLKVLDLDVVPGDDIIDLPLSLFTCGTLESLSLSETVRLPMVLVRSGVGYPKLEVHLPKLEFLKLRYVVYSSEECLPMLLSGCPVLNSLKVETISDNILKVSSSSLRRIEIILEDPGIVLKLEIDAPALEHLYLRDYIFEDGGIFKELSSLNEAYLYLRGPNPDDIVKLVQASNCVKLLVKPSIKLSARFKTLTKLVINRCTLG